MSWFFDRKGRDRALYEALTRHNYFPNQRASVGELPPSIDTRQFTPEVVEALAGIEDSRERKKSGYDLVEYKATRYNNVPRVLSLVHPKAYALLAKCIHDNWEHLHSVTENQNSIIKPEFHHEEKRLMVMNYEEPMAKVSRSHQKGFTKRFRVHADVANCFNSIYSHAIPWSLVGLNQAKAQQNERELWFNKLDMFQRKCKRNETLGIPIGSATSSIFAELILGCVDKKLREKEYEFYRYIDDYSCYCKSDDEAQEFLRDLGIFLAEYKLTLNLKKTVVEALPSPIEDSWVLELRGALPSRLGYSNESEPKLSATEALTFINRAIEVNKETPDGSVLKYAVSLILPHLDEYAPFHLIDPLLNLAWHFPVLLPLLDLLMSNAEVDPTIYRAQLIEIIKDNALKGRSDGMSWPLHSLIRAGCVVDDSTAELIINSKDCVAITMLLEMNIHRQKVVDFSNRITQSPDNYDKDSYWLLLYQLFKKGLINEPYGDGVFDCLVSFDVDFLPGERISEAEKRCEEIQKEIQTEALRQVFSPVLPDTNQTENPEF
ncbi:antiviral reverse transcriptase Drt4 [Pseudoalteromonas lipolytica]|uniref:antiviral reverse transcriptase Drt4 n=1 Tax=Pseudoalteromonas lipolytica TaxID=570156 RepID=UPI000C5CF354|nr:antiviral reverse transcriptase Drt4 [Pseudoalteromonas lipolytica]MAE01415.1 hypothetical protein [Pseudoalteromonas sp.]|tara:strand:+ start:6968 stop:8608 length:1641 start_codon:yes stop_codon:yes gene_type:complete